MYVIWDNISHYKHTHPYFKQLNIIVLFAPKTIWPHGDFCFTHVYQLCAKMGYSSIKKESTCAKCEKYNMFGTNTQVIWTPR